MRVLNLQDVSFLHAGHPWRAQPFDAILSEDFNGIPIVTVYYTGVPILVGHKTEVSGPNELPWDWYSLSFEGGRDHFHYQVYVDFLFQLGELNEEDQQTFLSSEMGYRDFEAALENGDGHPFCDFVDRVSDVADLVLEEKRSFASGA